MATVMGANRAGLQRRNARLDQTQIKHRFKYKQYSWSILTHAHFPLSFGSRFIIFLNLLSWLRVDLYARVLGIKLNSTHKTKKIRGGVSSISIQCWISNQSGIMQEFAPRFALPVRHSLLVEQDACSLFAVGGRLVQSAHLGR